MHSYLLHGAEQKLPAYALASPFETTTKLWVVSLIVLLLPLLFGSLRNDDGPGSSELLRRAVDGVVCIDGIVPGPVHLDEEVQPGRTVLGNLHGRQGLLDVGIGRIDSGQTGKASSHNRYGPSRGLGALDHGASGGIGVPLGLGETVQCLSLGSDGLAGLLDGLGRGGEVGCYGDHSSLDGPALKRRGNPGAGAERLAQHVEAVRNLSWLNERGVDVVRAGHLLPDEPGGDEIGGIFAGNDGRGLLSELSLPGGVLLLGKVLIKLGSINGGLATGELAEVGIHVGAEVFPVLLLEALEGNLISADSGGEGVGF